MAKDRELQDHERAHSGQPGSKVRHGADAVGKVNTPLRGINGPRPDLEIMRTKIDAARKELLKER